MNGRKYSLVTFLALLTSSSDAFTPTSRRVVRQNPTTQTQSALQFSSTLDAAFTGPKAFGKRPVQRNSIRLLPSKTLSSGRFSLALAAAKNDKDKENEDASSSSSSSFPPLKALANVSNQIKDKWDTSIDIATKVIPQPIQQAAKPVVDFLQMLYATWKKIRLYLFTFTAGAVLSISALLIPIYNQVSQLNEPVTLFETILQDLDQAYVEPVDTKKLFETGVSAMLRSLDPYTEFESMQAATDLTESIDGKYGGVGLVIAGIPESAKKATSPSKETSSTLNFNPMMNGADSNIINNNNNNKLLPKEAQEDNLNLDGGIVSTSATPVEKEEYDEDDDYMVTKPKKKSLRNQGIRVVSAFEGYAFDYGLRVGDNLLQIDDMKITPDTTVEQVRNRLRGRPGTEVQVVFQRDGVDGIQTVTIPRTVVQIRDVKLATLVGNPKDGIGYIQLQGFASDAGREMRQAITYLQGAAEDATNGEQTLQGLVIDLRNNPGGLLTSAIDVSSLLVPKGSDIVSAKGRGFPGVIYRSRVDPILDTSKTKLAVLVNGNTASAAEIVSGAVQDLDVGIVVGADRTFGKGLVQNVEELPFNTALKFTVAKYYTPSGRCIQGINYKEGGGIINDENDGRYVASRVDEKDRASFFTRTGRVVRDGGGIEADYKVASPKMSVLEATLLRTGVFNDFAADWSKNHQLTNNFQIDEDTYKEFQAFVSEKQKNGELQLEVLYEKPLSDLKKALKKSGYVGSEKSVEQLQARIVQDMTNDFEKYRSDIKEDIANNILARYLPESMLIERSIKNDVQVEEAIKLVKSRNKFDSLLAKGSAQERMAADVTANSLNVASSGAEDSEIEGFKSTISW